MDRSDSSSVIWIYATLGRSCADAEEVVATRLALEKAFELFDRTEDRLLAATSCLELAEFNMDQHDLWSASDWFDQAAEYYDSTRESRYCRTQS